MEPILRKGDVGRNSLEQVMLQSQLYLGAQLLPLSLGDLEATLKDYEEIYLSGDFDRMSAYLVFTHRRPDFAVIGGVFPEFDFEGRSLQNFATPWRLDLLTYSTVPFQGSGAVAFVWDSARCSSCVQFVRSLAMISDAHLPDVLVRLAFEHFENTFADPRWWEGLSSSERDQFQLRISTAASPQNRQSNCLTNDGLRTAHWKVIARECARTQGAGYPLRIPARH